MAYLPTEPLIPHIQRKLDTELLGQGGYDAGVMELAYELARTSNITPRSAFQQIMRILNHKLEFVSDRTADRIACALGKHPRDIWPEFDNIPLGRFSRWACLMRVRRIPALR